MHIVTEMMIRERDVLVKSDIMHYQTRIPDTHWVDLNALSNLNPDVTCAPNEIKRLAPAPAPTLPLVSTFVCFQAGSCAGDLEIGLFLLDKSHLASYYQGCSVT
jgi:hypothetical protein